MVSLMSYIPFSQLASSIFRRFVLPDHYPNIAIRLHERAFIGVIFLKMTQMRLAPLAFGRAHARARSCSCSSNRPQSRPCPAKPVFRTRINVVTRGECLFQKRGASLFDLQAPLSLGDCANDFNSRAVLDLRASNRRPPPQSPPQSRPQRRCPHGAAAALGPFD